MGSFGSVFPVISSSLDLTTAPIPRPLSVTRLSVSRFRNFPPTCNRIPVLSSRSNVASITSSLRSVVWGVSQKTPSCFSASSQSGFVNSTLLIGHTVKIGLIGPTVSTNCPSIR